MSDKSVDGIQGRNFALKLCNIIADALYQDRPSTSQQLKAFLAYSFDTAQLDERHKFAVMEAIEIGTKGRVDFSDRFGKPDLYADNRLSAFSTVGQLIDLAMDRAGFTKPREQTAEHYVIFVVQPTRSGLYQPSGRVENLRNG